MKNINSKIEPYSRLICRITNEEKTFDNINQYFDAYPIVNNRIFGRVWILIGKDKSEKYRALNVAQSEDIKKEIVSDVKAMFNSEYKKNCPIQRDIQWEINNNLDVIKNPVESNPSAQGKTFIYQKNQDKNPYLYRFLFKTYSDLVIYEVDIDSYLGIDESSISNQVIKDIFAFGKDYYAESRLAVETQALYWNYYRSGIGKRSYLHFRPDSDNIMKRNSSL